MKKSEIINQIINTAISPNWQGLQAQKERNAMEIELKKQTKQELLKELGIVENK